MLKCDIWVEGQLFSSARGTGVSIVDSPVGNSLFLQTLSSEEASSPWDLVDIWFRLLLVHNSGTAISGLGLPFILDFTAWPDAHYVEFEGQSLAPNQSDSKSFFWRGDISSISSTSPVPEPGTTSVFLLLGLLGMLVFRARFCSRI